MLSPCKPSAPCADDVPPLHRLGGPQRPSARRRPLLLLKLKLSLQDLLDYFARRGGILGGDDVAALMRPHVSQPVGLLARWIVDRRLLSLCHHGQLLIPMFQFDTDSMALRAQVSLTLAALPPDWDELRRATWFARPHELLDGFTPLVALHGEALAVLAAARATGR